MAVLGIDRGIRGGLLDAIELEFDMPFASRSQCRVEFRECLAETVHTQVRYRWMDCGSLRTAFSSSERRTVMAPSRYTSRRSVGPQRLAIKFAGDDRLKHIAIGNVRLLQPSASRVSWAEAASDRTSVCQSSRSEFAFLGQLFDGRVMRVRPWLLGCEPDWYRRLPGSSNSGELSSGSLRSVEVCGKRSARGFQGDDPPNEREERKCNKGHRRSRQDDGPAGPSELPGAELFVARRT